MAGLLVNIPQDALLMLSSEPNCNFIYIYYFYNSHYNDIDILILPVMIPMI